MSFVTVSHWTSTEITDEMMAKRDLNFIPFIIGVCASGVQMVRTGDLSLCVVKQYPDAETAQSA